jgi:hypothetical protein
MAMQVRSRIKLMSMEKKSNTPYKSLGLKLQRIRQNKKQSVSEVSGSVEIDENLLISIEEGRKRPTQDLLLLLISHFNIEDEEASRVWSLAGYESLDIDKNDQDLSKYPPILMLVPMDNKIVYSDKAEIVANTNGIVINFFQQPNGPYQQQTISRIGMSKEQAKELVKILERTITQSENIKKSNQSKQKPAE